MRINELTDNLKAKAIASTAAATAACGWLSSINDIGKTYDFLLLIPPTYSDEQPRERSWRSYNITAYLFRQNKNEDGNRFTDQQRDEAWGALQYGMDLWIDSIIASTDLDGRIDMKIIDQVRCEPDENGLGNDDLVWVKAQFTLKVNNCPT